MPHLSVAIIGAGAFGGWTALHLLRQGARVQLFDAWGPGHSRASSGGETRIIRTVYGKDELYSRLVARSFELWKHFDQQQGTSLLVPSPKLWMFSQPDDAYARQAMPIVNSLGYRMEEYPQEEARKRYPQVDYSDVRHLYLERDAGYLYARQACREVVRAFVQEGGTFRQLQVMPGKMNGGRMTHALAPAGEKIEADLFVFAGGPWMASLFPEVLGPHLSISRQEVYFFGTPAGSEAFAHPQMPIWLDFGEQLYYGIPSGDQRGFKLADDTRRAPLDPTSDDRLPSPEGISAARRFLARRFPALAGAPLVEARVCQYTNTRDGHFLIDRHPEAANVWLAGAGNGHGFKMGPAIGEYLSEQIGQPDNTDPIPSFRLERLDRIKAPKTQFG